MPPAIRLPDRRSNDAAPVLASWRRLTGGGPDRNVDRRTLVACSAGADSSALALILRSATTDLAIAHVVHDLRPSSESLADRDRARTLAEGLGLEFVEGSARVSALSGNPESLARRARYAELARLAQIHHCPWIATAHHADDQLETMVMRLIRGAGVRGLAGIAERRPIGDATVIRPMLAIDRVAVERICSESGWEWAHDRTNTDLSRLRARVRAEILPRVRAIGARSSEHAVSAGRLLHMASGMIESRAESLMRAHAREKSPGGIEIARPALRACEEIVAGEVIRRCVARAGAGGMDRLGSSATDAIVRAIREHRGERKRFVLRRAMILIDADTVRILGREGAGDVREVRDAGG